MITRREVLINAVEECIKELYTLAQPSIKWEDFIKENKEYNDNYNKWELFNKAFSNREKKPEVWKIQKERHPDWENKNIVECIGPAPYEFYYLPAKVFEEIKESYVYAYKLDGKQNLLDILDTIKNYFEKPIVDKYIKAHTDEKGDYHPGYRGYEELENLKTKLFKITNSETQAEEIENIIYDFFDKISNFFRWDGESNSFKISIALGATPFSNKEEVIKNWKKYRNKDIEIDENKYKEEYDY